VFTPGLMHLISTKMDPSERSLTSGTGVSTIAKCSGPGIPEGIKVVRVTVLEVNDAAAMLLFCVVFVEVVKIDRWKMTRSKMLRTKNLHVSMTVL
jgi:hypothetical protein